MSSRPSIEVAVVMRRERLANRWQPYRWVPADVVPHEAAFGTGCRLLFEDENEARWLHPGFVVELFNDDVEGYYLNASTPNPGLFVLWRMDEPGAGGDEPMARPVAVSLSYHEAGRWLDAQENVDPIPAPPGVVQWLRDFVDANYIPEPRRRKRPESFRSLQDRFGNPVSITTEKGGGGGHG